MINLLSNKNKKLIQREYYARLGVLALSLLIILAIFFVAALLPTFSNLKYSKQSLEVKIESFDSVGSPTQTISLKELNKEIDLLLERSIVRQFSMPILINEINELAEEKGIKVYSYEFESDTEGEDADKLFIEGNSPNRASILELAESLKGLAEVRDVETPYSQFLDDENIRLTITLILENYEK